jgi:hypothetical protein
MNLTNSLTLVLKCLIISLYNFIVGLLRIGGILVLFRRFIIYEVGLFYMMYE